MNLTPNVRLFAAAALVAAAAALASCGKSEPEAAESVAVSIVSATASASEGSQFVTVTATGGWTLSLEGGELWASLSKTSGSGSGNSVLKWSANGSEESRSLTVCISSSSGSAKASCLFTQEGKVNGGKTDDDVELRSDPVASWLELPDVPQGLYFITHEMTAGKYNGRGFSFALNPEALVAEWVAYPLNKTLIGSGSRTNDWGLDPKVPKQYQAVLYRGFGSSSNGEWFERGHQLPSADRLSPETNRQTFYGTNMTPQRGSLNEHAWASLEGMVRSWAYNFDTLYVVTGCSLEGSTDWALDNEGKKVTVPTGYFKALLGYKKNGTIGITPSTGGYTSIGFWFDHTGYDDNQVMQQSMTVAELERKTGFDFFTNLPALIGKETADEVESTLDSWWK